MDGSRRSARAERHDGDALVRAVARSLAAHVAPGARIAVALSGGRDSVALLTAVLDCRRADPRDVVAIHVHHGLSRNADDWAAFCTRLSASQGIELVTQHVRVDGLSRGVEAAARTARYEALAAGARAAEATAVLLAHHQDDQAETVLLQLLRGAGVQGLAAMPAARHDGRLLWLRPLLDVPRRDVDGFVRARGLTYVEDDSNASDRHRRNALRRHVVPALADIATGYPGTLARAAAHQAEAASLIDELAALDAGALLHDGTLDRAGLAALAPHRARNVLRHFLQLHGLRPPSSSRLESMLAQLRGAKPDAQVRLAHDAHVFGVFRGRVVAHHDAPSRYERAWKGEARLALPHGMLTFTTTRGSGVSALQIDGCALVVRPRSGGERLQPYATRPRRALKAWLYEAHMPKWQRDALPLLFCDDLLVAVPGLGVDVAFQAKAGEPAFTLDWDPQGR